MKIVKWFGNAAHWTWTSRQVIWVGLEQLINEELLQVVEGGVKVSYD